MLASGGSTVQQQQQQQGEPGAAVQPSRRSPPKKNLSHSEHFVPEAGSNYFLDPQNRWAGDFIQEEQRRRAERLRQKEDQLARRRQETVRKEAARAAAEEAHLAAEAARLARLAAAAGPKSNQSKAPFDILTLQYKPTADGERLRLQDEAQQRRAQQRSYRLYERNNTVTHNIITGQPPPLPGAYLHSPV